MSESQPQNDESREHRLDELITQYLEREEAGQPVEAEELLKQYSDLRGEFRDFLSQHKRMKQGESPTTTFEGRSTADPGLEHLTRRGEVVGDCRILRELGRGGMGVVYLAEHIRVKDLRAVKILPRNQVSDHSIQRFWREARSAARINHLNVVTIYDVGHIDDLHYIVMQFVEGKTLVDVINQHMIRTSAKPFPWLVALRIAVPVLDALSAVHAEGLVHRDIKPSNIMVTGAMSRKFHVLLMDFGLVQDEQAADITESGGVVGTPVFMSQEQAMGHSVDRRTDIYSVGATLYFLLASQPPFSGTKTEVYLKVAAGERPVPLKELRPDIPGGVCEIISRAMEPSRDHRYDRAEEMVKDVTAVLGKMNPSTKKRSIPEDAAPKGNRVSQHDGGSRAVAASADATFQAHDDTVSCADTSGESLPGIARLEPVKSPAKELPFQGQSSSAREVSIKTDPSSWLDRTQEALNRRWPLALVAIASFILLGMVIFTLTQGGHDTRRNTTGKSELSDGNGGDTIHKGMVFIPAGSVQLGATEKQIRSYASTVELLKDDSDLTDQLVDFCCRDSPRQEAVGGFWIDKYEVTNTQYAQFVNATGHPAPTNWVDAVPPRGTGDHPVTSVTPEDAQAYARWAGKKLPTEAQWVRAYRGDSDRLFPWGDNWISQKANVFENSAFPRGASPVDSSPDDRSLFGILNMVGQVREILRDRVRRGGEVMAMTKGSHAEANGSIYALAPSRFYLGEGLSDKFIGFRCVIEETR